MGEGREEGRARLLKISKWKGRNDKKQKKHCSMLVVHPLHKSTSDQPGTRAGQVRS